MIKRGRLYEPPPTGERDIKELLQYAVDRGIGQLVDSNGVPKNKWTPASMADAIALIDHPDADVDVRTVQYWFDAKNRRNISPKNCRWLAQIFGCGSPDEISAWQIALLAARRVFMEHPTKTAPRPLLPDIKTEHRAPAGRQPDSGLHSSHGIYTAHASPTGADASISSATARAKRQLPARLERFFADPMILPVVVWFWLTGILFLAAMLGVLSVSYTTPDGTSKQVGYLWSPSWIIHDLVLLPLFLMVVSSVINFWKNDARLLFLNARSKRSAHEGWLDKVNSLSILHWVALAISVFFVFLLQWVGGYLVPILNNEMGNAAVSWVNIILARPDIMSVGSALALSGFYFLFAAIVFFFLNGGFVFLYAVWSDFSDLYKNATTMHPENDGAKMRFVGIKLVGHIFLGTILALWISTSIKLYAMYISVNSTDILTWIYTDFRQLFDGSVQRESIVVGYSLSQFSTIIFTSVIAGVFLFVFHSARALFKGHDDVSDHAPWGKWLSVIMLLLVNFLCVGQVDGFSLLLLLSVVATAYCVFTHRGTTFGLDKILHGTSAAKQ